MTCEPHVEAELREEMRVEEEAAAVELAGDVPARSWQRSPYPPPPPVVDPDTATITARVR